MDIYIGFDLAWMDNPKKPGAICAIGFENGTPTQFHEPRLVSFAEALLFIQTVRSQDGCTLIALDQPTVVQNIKGMRPDERVAASLVSWLGGGVQPANRGRLGMFCDNAPIWRFIENLGAIENPEEARKAAKGLYLMEVFPALALASMNPDFFGRLNGPRYNPERKKTFRMSNWIKVAKASEREALAFGCLELAAWCQIAASIIQPKKGDQDKIDAVLCLLIALRWRLRSREESLMIGELNTGYMILPVSKEVRRYLTIPAQKYSVALDGAYERSI